MSQNTNINLKNKTVTLDEEQLTQVDKGLRNEKRQRERIKQLEKALFLKDSIILKLQEENEKIVKKIIQNSELIKIEGEKAYKFLDDLYKNQIKKSKNNNGFYAGIEYLTTPVNSPFLKFDWVRSKMIIKGGLSKINVGQKSNLSYSLGVSLKLF